jgi:Flp pilus assembly protein TadG
MAALIRRLRACGRGEDGAELIEFVIVFPILMLILAGILDFGMMFRSFEVVTNAAREGARVAILPGYELDAPVKLRVQEYLDASGLNSTAVTERVTYPVTIGVAPNTKTFTAHGVRVTYTYQMLVLSGVSQLFGGGIGDVPLRSVAVMRSETQAAAP